MSKMNDFKELEKEIFRQHNLLRSDPQSFIKKVKNCMKYYSLKIYHPPGEDPVQTYEGKEIISEVIQFLKAQKPVELLEYSESIALACRDHVKDIGPKGLTSHEGSDDKNIAERLEKYCEWDGVVSESIDFGFTDPQNIILNLLIDDGVEDRYQRLNLFNENFKYVGVSVGPHREYGICVVIGYATNIRPLGSEPKRVYEFVQSYIKNTMNTNKKAVNQFQEEEPDAPDNTVSMKVFKFKKIIGGLVKNITKKVFFLDNGAQHIVEVEDN